MESFDRLLASLQWVPLWFWVALAASVAGAFVKFFGWRGAIPALVAVLSLGLAANVRRRGWEAREKEGAENVKRVVAKAEQARLESDRRNADPEQLRKTDGYRRD